jgi:hypothetical protein
MTLSEAERKVVFLMRSLGPYEKFEVRLNEHGRLSIVITKTTKEDFPQTVV